MSKEKPIVHLRVYLASGNGNTVSYDANKKVLNENILVKLVHDTLEWYNYLKHLKVNGFVKCTVENVLQNKKKIDSAKFQKEVDKAFEPIKHELTPEQKKIAELEAKIEELAKGQGSDDKLTKARAEYQEVVGKQAFHGWDIETIKAKIQEEKSK